MRTAERDEAALPRQLARTRRFVLGVPRGFAVLGGARPRVLFLRGDSGDDPVTHLWVHDVEDGGTRRLVDARAVDADPTALPEEERLRRERARELADGITTFSVDRDGTLVAFALGGRLHTLALGDPAARPVLHPLDRAVFDPRVAPDASAIAFHAAGGLTVLGLDARGSGPGSERGRVEEAGVAWGRAEFVAAEEMGRTRGFWWSPDARRLAVARVDESPVDEWTLADPTDPAAPARTVRYPAAGTPNARVGLALVDARTLERTPVELPTDDGYLAVVRWDADPLLVLWQRRDQREALVLQVGDDGSVREVRRIARDPWVELVTGVPAWCDGRLITVEDDPAPEGVGTRRVHVDGAPVGPVGLQVREIVGVGDGRVVAVVSDTDPTRWRAVAFSIADGSVTELAPSDADVHRVVAAPASSSAPVVHVTATLDGVRPRVRVAPATGGPMADLDVVSEDPVVRPAPRSLRLGRRRLASVLLLPPDAPPDARLPVLLDPYGGPHAQRVVASGGAFVTSQWFADRGFAVLVVDGRGTPGRGPVWEASVAGDLAAAALEDQMDALAAAAEEEPRLDLGRVGIRGWSYGGTLAALAVLRRPDVVRAAVAGAPVTDWRLYDTHYTERYLGDPVRDAEAYRASSLVDAEGSLVAAAPWGDDPPSLLLVHGLVDDNVVAAHALRLSRALFLDGRPHRFLPLPGVTHLAAGSDVTTRLLMLELAFLREALAPRGASATG